MIHRKHFQHKNTTTQTTSTYSLDPFQKELHTTRTSLTLNTDVTPIGMKTFVIKTNWNKKILTTNLMIKNWKWRLGYGCTCIKRTTTCTDWFVEIKSPFNWYIVNPQFSAETTKPTKAKCSHWRPNFTTTPGNTRGTRKVSPTIIKLAIKKQVQNAIISNWFRGVKNPRAHRYGCFVQRHSGSQLTKKSITGSAYNNK